MNRTDWKSREDLQARLDATLAEPHMVDALTVLVQMGLPNGTQVADLTINALKNAYNEGYFKALANLRLLCRIKEVESHPLPPPWQKNKG